MTLQPYPVDLDALPLQRRHQLPHRDRLGRVRIVDGVFVVEELRGRVGGRGGAEGEWDVVRPDGVVEDVFALAIVSVFVDG